MGEGTYKRLLISLWIDTVQITIEDARVSVDPEQDQGVGKWLEERLDGGFESLVRLGVVVHNESYCVDWRYLHESIVEDFS